MKACRRNWCLRKKFAPGLFGMSPILILDLMLGLVLLPIILLLIGVPRFMDVVKALGALCNYLGMLHLDIPAGHSFSPKLYTAGI